MEIATPKSTAPRLFCFVLMPFDDSFSDVYGIGIREACEAAGAYCERVDEQIFQERILDRIYNQIAKADLIIADMTGKNPNVFYEVGYAHALGKPTVLITKSAEDIPFDLKHFPHIVYGAKLTVLREELERRVRWHATNPQVTVATDTADWDLYYDNSLIGSAPVILRFATPRTGTPPPYFRFLIHNRSMDEIPAESMKVHLIGEEVAYSRPSGDRIDLPDGRKALDMGSPILIRPDEIVPFDITLKPLNLKAGAQRNVILKFYTRKGSREFPLILKRDA